MGCCEQEAAVKVSGKTLGSCAGKGSRAPLLHGFFGWLSCLKKKALLVFDTHHIHHHLVDSLFGQKTQMG